MQVGGRNTLRRAAEYINGQQPFVQRYVGVFQCGANGDGELLAADKPLPDARTNSAPRRLFWPEMAGLVWLPEWVSGAISRGFANVRNALSVGALGR